MALDTEPAELVARECSCTFCSAIGAAWVSVSGARLKVFIAEPMAVSKYSFGSKTADFHVCAKCGVVPVVISRIEGRSYAVINANTLKPMANTTLTRVPVTHDEESDAVRLARRAKSWIGDVEIVEGSS